MWADCLPCSPQASAPLDLAPRPSRPSYLDPGSPGIIAFHVQEFIHIDFQLWDLLSWGGVGEEWERQVA